MSAPVNTARVISYVTKREPTINNDLLIKLAGGSHEQWYPSLKGQRASCIVQAVNQILKDNGMALASEGIGSEQWQFVTCHEKNLREMNFNLSRIDAHYKNVVKSIEAIAYDHRAPTALRNDANAWLELMTEPRSDNGLVLLKEFALELKTKASKHGSTPKLKLIETKEESQCPSPT